MALFAIWSHRAQSAVEIWQFFRSPLEMLGWLHARGKDKTGSIVVLGYSIPDEERPGIVRNDGTHLWGREKLIFPARCFRCGLARAEFERNKYRERCERKSFDPRKA